MSTPAPQSAIVAAGLGATFQIFRIASDLISTASQHAEIVEKAEAEKKRKNRTSATKSKTKRQSSIFYFNGRLSTTFLGKESKHGKKESITLGSNNDLTNSSNNEELSQYEIAEMEFLSSKTSFEKILPVIGFTTHVCLLTYFVTMFVLNVVDEDFSYLVYSAYPLGGCAVALLINVIMDFRDWIRIRFSVWQRSLNFIASAILFLGSLALMLKSRNRAMVLDYVSLGCLVVHFILSVVEIKVYQYPPSKVKTEGKKAVLSRKAIFIILKPYFWPDATATSALLNRTRAMLTWFCVSGAKACNLIAPIFIGKASTALAWYDYKTCIKFTVLYNATLFVGNFLKECQSLVYLKVAQAAFVQLSEVSFHHLHSLSLDWHLKKKLGEVIRSMDRGIAACDILMKYAFLWLLPALAECLLVCVIFATYFQYFPVAVVVFFFVFVYIVLTICVTLWRKKFRKKVAKSDNDWHDRCTDSLINFETVKFFTAEEYEKKRFGESVKVYQSGSVEVQASLSLLNIVQQMLSQGCIATALIITTLGIMRRYNCCIDQGCESGNSECCNNIGLDTCPGMEIGDFITVLTYTLNLFIPLNFLGSVYNAIVMAIVDLTNLSELLAEDPDIKDNPDALQLPRENKDNPLNVVEFDKVFFHYPSQTEESGIKELSFIMKKGTVTALVGSTGSGKTTCSRLLFRFYDVLGGAVKVNGLDVRAVTQKSLRDIIGVVPQNTTLFNDTVKNNILYGRRDASMEDLRLAVKDAQLEAFIESLPDGWETMVGDRGLKLSGGEKQRVSIARCLLKNPPIVVLDEATSALDTVTESSVQAALDRLGSERTCLVIAHRLGTIRNADNIIVLDKGRVLEQGSHDELLELDGKYAEMWNMQLHSTSQRNSAVDLTKL